MSDKTINLNNYEENLETLAEEMEFPLGFDGKEMPKEMKKAMLNTFLTFGVMS